MAVDNFYTDSITGGAFTPVGGTEVDLGCVGALSGQAEVRTKQLMCAGVPVAQKTKPLSMELTYRGHIPVSVYSALFGLKSETLTPEKKSYNVNSEHATGEFKFVESEFYGEKKRTRTFPNASVISGMAFSVENGAEDIAEVELTIKALKDANGDIYTEEDAAVV